MSKNELRSGGKHRRCGFANGAGELRGQPQVPPLHKMNTFAII